MSVIKHITDLPRSIWSSFICPLCQHRGLTQTHRDTHSHKSMTESIKKLALYFIFIGTYIRSHCVQHKSECGGIKVSGINLWLDPVPVHTQHSRGQWSEATGSTMKSCRAPPTICFFHRCNWRRAHNTKQQKKVGHNPTVLTRSPRYWLFFHLFFFCFFLLLYI